MMTADERDEMLLHGALAERERIIALLDTLKCGCDVDCDIVEISFRNLVTLINEEDK